jgi:hypothetical protein
VATRSAKLLSTVSNVDNFSDTFTCPSFNFVIVKSFMVQNRANAPNSMTLYVYDPTRGTLIYIFNETMDPLSWLFGELWAVLQPDDVLVAGATLVGAHFWVSGAKLPLPS